MWGVILAGGNGTRLNPLTNVTNKHLLPVYNKPMVYYPLEFLINVGIKNIILITGKEHAGSFADLLGDGSRFGVNITYKVQEGALGIAHALGITENVVRDEPVIVVLGDNVFSADPDGMERIKALVRDFGAKADGAVIFLKEVEDPERFGVPEFDGNNKIKRIEEKPKEPKSRYAVIGLYMYDRTVFDKIRALKPSWRNELELTDVNNAYLADKKLDYHIIDWEWTDAGTFESLFRANSIARKSQIEKRI
jgi:glucose-1-phosphate thymidylyltransferase